MAKLLLLANHDFVDRTGPPPLSTEVFLAYGEASDAKIVGNVANDQGTEACVGD